jgi:hypothetical protein
MQAVHTHQTLMTRIVETQRRAAITRDEARPPRRRQPSFTGRYQGTEFATVVTTFAPPREPVMSRGRLFVLVSGTAAIGLIGLVVNAALAA